MADFRLNWGVVVLAGGRVEPELAGAIGTDRKAMALLGGRTCVARVLDAVRDAGFSACATVGGTDVHDEVHHGVKVLEEGTTIENARATLAALPGIEAVLFLPADAPLLTPQALESFARASEERVTATPWYAVGLCRAEAFTERFPALPITPLRFQEGAYLSGALYATDPAGFHRSAALFERVVASRKSQLGMLIRVGPGLIWRYYRGKLTIPEAEQRAGRLLGGQAFIMPDCDPATAVDLDDVSDWAPLRAHFGEAP